MEKQFYRISEVSQILSIGKSLTYRLVAEQQIPSVWIAGCRARRVPKEALDNWIAQQLGQSDSDRGR